MTKQEGPGPVEIVNELGAKWSPDLDSYVSGETNVSQLRCALCANAPYTRPEIGTPEYFALIDARHGRTSK